MSITTIAITVNDDDDDDDIIMMMMKNRRHIFFTLYIKINNCKAVITLPE